MEKVLGKVAGTDPNWNDELQMWIAGSETGKNHQYRLTHQGKNPSYRKVREFKLGAITDVDRVVKEVGIVFTDEQTCYVINDPDRIKRLLWQLTQYYNSMVGHKALES